MNYARAKKAFLYGCKAVGLFWLARRLTNRGLRILCYHGFAADDCCEFRPKLFINLDTFKKRLDFLSKQRYPIVKLQDALSALERGKASNGLTVITIDDGFFSVQLAWQLLKSCDFPATVYVTSYYSSKEMPIYRLAVQYLFWKTETTSLPPSALLPIFPNGCSWSSSREREQMAWKIIEFGEQLSAESERGMIIRHLSECLGVDSHQFLEGRSLGLLNAREISALADQGLDVQLHTHRHKELTDPASVKTEICDNRAALEPLVGPALRHFCYPNGVWSRSLWPALASLQIESAVTCEAGLNFRHTPRLALHRFLDGEDISQVEFEAEMAGLTELLRRARSSLRIVFSRPEAVHTKIAREQKQA
jgi:peptidoglycan/xylan/chitin deacetylase (PgdA/CDA1 family)